MKIFQAHNEYLYPGGEDSVAASEAVLLRARGHQVIEFRQSNQDLQKLSFSKKAIFYGRDIFHSKDIYRQVRELIDKQAPDVAHFHNSFFMITPAAYEACFDAGVPVVQTLHNYRFLCANGVFYRRGQVCQDCLSQGRAAGVRHACWHGSLPASFLMTRVIEEYSKRKILSRVAQFIALSQFSKAQFVSAGWPQDKIMVKPNSLEVDPGVIGSAPVHVLYVGALQDYKGVRTLLKAWASREWSIPLKIAGSGPLDDELKDMKVENVEFLGQRSSAEVISLIRNAACVVCPSECFENFPRVILESFACGVPVIASRLGAIEELVDHGRTGLLFKSGDAADLAAAVRLFLEDRDMRTQLGQAARSVFEQKFTAAMSCNILERLYDSVIVKAAQS